MLLGLSIRRLRHKERNALRAGFQDLRIRLPRTARIRMFASRTTALFGIPLLLAAGSADFFVLLHKVVFRYTPRRDHRVEFLGHGAHCFYFGFPAPLVRGNEEAQCFAMTSDGQRTPALQITCELLTEFPHANLLGVHSAYLVYTISRSAL